MRHHFQDLITIFNDCFAETYNTRLIKGGDEPIYLPAGEHHPYHGVFFAHGYFASALHECAHWLIAGAERRKQVDFGYWYEPDGRTAAQQVIFQDVESKPQALEWILSHAAGYRFCVSVDNLNGAKIESNLFKQAIYKQLKMYCEQGLAPRASIFRQALCQFYGTSPYLCIDDFTAEWETLK